MCHANNEKQKTTHNRKNGTTKQEKIRTQGEKETYKLFGILETDTIKQVKTKEKIKKRISQENEKTTWNQTILQEPYKRDKHLGYPLRKIFGTIFEMDEEKTQTRNKILQLKLVLKSTRSKMICL